MGRFEKGRWVRDSHDDFFDAMVNVSSAFSGVAERLLVQLNDWDNSSGVFRKGQYMKHSELMAECMDEMNYQAKL